MAMDIKDICSRIYEIALPYCKRSEAPIAYISVVQGKRCSFSSKELYEEFNSLKWNTPLASSELEITKTQNDVFLQVDYIIEFEDDSGKSVAHSVPFADGSISEDIGCTPSV